MAEVTVVKPGLLLTIQDLGRWGFQHQGLSVAGAMDAASHRVANALVGNAPGDATLEATMIGPQLVFDAESVFAVAGGTFDLKIDDRPVPMNQACSIHPGERLIFGRRRGGCRAYVAVAGGLAVPIVFGSRSTHVPSRMGGLQGRALRAGDRVPVGRSAVGRTPARLPVPGPSDQDGVRTVTRVRVVLGPQSDSFADASLQVLLSSEYLMRPESDRMGCRLAGPAVEHRGTSEIITDATPMGALQVPASGQPILLMADRPTTGGYPIAATVITADLDRVAQLAPGDSLAFDLCTREEAVQALAGREEWLAKLERGEVR